MDAEYRRYISHDGPPKKKWVLQRFPIKGGFLLRSAMQVSLYRTEIKWIEFEGLVTA